MLICLKLAHMPRTHDVPFTTHHHRHHHWFGCVRLRPQWLFGFDASFWYKKKSTCHSRFLPFSFANRMKSDRLLNDQISFGLRSFCSIPFVSFRFDSIHFALFRSSAKNFWGRATFGYASNQVDTFVLCELHIVNWMRILSTLWHWFHFTLIDSLRFNTWTEMIMTFEQREWKSVEPTSLPVRACVRGCMVMFVCFSNTIQQSFRINNRTEIHWGFLHLTAHEYIDRNLMERWI